jgi:hypothetical protein
MVSGATLAAHTVRMHGENHRVRIGCGRGRSRSAFERDIALTLH